MHTCHNGSHWDEMLGDEGLRSIMGSLAISNVSDIPG